MNRATPVRSGSPTPHWDGAAVPPREHPDPGAAARRRPVPRSWGWALPGGGRAASVDPGTSYQGTSTQVCGLYPFTVASGAAPPGVPLGRHLLTAEAIGFDPAAWLGAGLVTNTGTWIQGQPGVGKSAIVKRIMTGLVAFGFTAVVPGDIKGEYTDLVQHLGGRVWRIQRGVGALNPLEAGPLRHALAHTGREERVRLEETIRARRLSLLEALVAIVRRAEVGVTERRLLDIALDRAVIAAGPHGDPVIPDVVRILSNPSAELLAVGACDTVPEFRRVARELINTLGLLCAGAIRGLFDRPSTITADLDTPALSLDISALDDDDDDVVAAAMLSSWTWAAAVIDGSAALGRRRNVLRVQDELWRALRVAPGLVERSDRVTRLGRHRGEVSIQVTHSLDDLEALPTEVDRAKARGLAARNGVVVLGGMDERELDRIGRITPLSRAEQDLVRGWAAPPSWIPGSIHPGRGKVLIKSGERTGLPVELSLTPTERRLYNTDLAWRQP